MYSRNSHLSILLGESRSKTCSTAISKLDMIAIIHLFLEANVFCAVFSGNRTASSRTKGEATQFLSQLDGEVSLTGRVLRAVVSCLCFCSHWYFLMVTLFSFRLSFLIP